MTQNHKNQIDIIQNDDKSILLMRARKTVYRRAQYLLYTQLFATIIVPVAFGVLGIYLSDIRPWSALYAISTLILDSLIIDRVQKELIADAARISEEFDCRVLNMNWNGFVVGEKLDKEEIHRLAKKSEEKEEMRDWYPPIVKRAPIHTARVYCQRTNVWYDQSLRRGQKTVVAVVLLVFAVAAFAIGNALSLSISDLIIFFFTPALPAVSWSIRDTLRQQDAADASKRIKKAAENLWTQAVDKQAGPEDCATRSREFQDAIFSRRTNSPLPFPFVYALKRKSMEDQMNSSADEYLREAGLI